MERHASRREFLWTAGGAAAGLGLAAIIAVEPARATPVAMQEAIRKVVGSARVNTGRVKLELPPLSENGNAVPLTVSVESPMTARDRVTAIHLLLEQNPEPEAAQFTLGPRCGKAEIATRVRMFAPQKVHGLAAMSDGTFWIGSIHVEVTLAACVEIDVK